MESSPSGGSAGRASGLSFAENGTIDPLSLNDLYRLVGWDRGGRRTTDETAEMLRVSHYYIAAYAGDLLVGFARVCGDPYVAQVLDVITHPEYRRLGIATRCMEGVRGPPPAVSIRVRDADRRHRPTRLLRALWVPPPGSGDGDAPLAVPGSPWDRAVMSLQLTPGGRAANAYLGHWPYGVREQIRQS